MNFSAQDRRRDSNPILQRRNGGGDSRMIRNVVNLSVYWLSTVYCCTSNNQWSLSSKKQKQETLVYDDSFLSTLWKGDDVRIYRNDVVKWRRSERRISLCLRRLFMVSTSTILYGRERNMAHWHGSIVDRLILVHPPDRNYGPSYIPSHYRYTETLFTVDPFPEAGPAEAGPPAGVFPLISS